jgi:acetylglutamate kinase
MCNRCAVLAWFVTCSTPKVIHIAGEMLEVPHFQSIMQDISLLHTLGIKLVLVAGCRPQLERRLKSRQISSQFHGSPARRITCPATLESTKDAAGYARVELESKLGRQASKVPLSHFLEPTKHAQCTRNARKRHTHNSQKHA